MTLGNNSAPQLKSFIERIERLNEEIKNLGIDRKEVYKELAGQGFIPKTVRDIVRRNATDAAKLAEDAAMLETYLHALGELADLPLGQAAMAGAGK